MHSGVVKNEPRMEVNAVIKHAGVGGWVRCCLDAGGGGCCSQVCRHNLPRQVAGPKGSAVTSDIN